VPSFAGGALFGVANPKAWVAIAAVFASTRLADTAIADEAAKIALLSVMIVLINATWLIAGASLAPMLRNPHRSRIINPPLPAHSSGRPPSPSSTDCPRAPPAMSTAARDAPFRCVRRPSPMASSGFPRPHLGVGDS
jgi:hypothetical protein